MKILQINKFYYLRGGSERYLFELSNVLEKNGHEVIPFTMASDNNQPSKYKKYFVSKVDVNKFNIINIIKSFYNRDAVKKLKALIEEEKPDIAHLHNISHHLSPAIIKTLKDKNIKVVQTLHDYKAICPNRQFFSRGELCFACQGKKYYHCFFRKCIQRSHSKSFLGMLEAYWNDRFLGLYGLVDKFIAPSEYIKNKFVAFGYPQEKIEVVNNFISDEFISGLPEKAENEDRRSRYLLYFGRLSKEKGIEVLLEALKGNKNAIKLKIVGAGPEYKKIKKIIKHNKLQKKVELTGPKYNSDLFELIANAYAIIIPSIWPENMPYSLLEAMLMGKVIIASNIGGMPEIIEDGKNGFLFTPGDSNDLRKKISALKNFDLDMIMTNAEMRIKSLNQKWHYRQIIKIYDHVHGDRSLI